ncbi:hypothetical protein SQ56_27900, partial [Klebsiella variicola]
MNGVLYTLFRGTARSKKGAEAPFLFEANELAQNFSYNARANGTAAFTDCETQTVVHRDRVDQG